MSKKKSIWKLICFIYKIYPSFWPLVVVCQMAHAAISFVSVIFSSFIIDALVEGRSYEVVFTYAVWMVVADAVLVLFWQGMEKVINVRKYNLDNCIWNEIASHALIMDYELLEKRETMEMIHKALEGMRSHGGPQMLCENVAKMVRCLVDIIYSVILLVPLFIPKEADVGGQVPGILNSPFGIIPIVVVLVIQLIILYIFNRKYVKIQQKSFEINATANTKLGYLLSPIMEYAQGKDIRMSRLDIPFFRSYRENSKELLERSFLVSWKGAKLASVNMLPAAVFSVICYLYVGAKALYGLVTVGNVAKYVSAFTKFGTVLGDVVNLYISLQINCDYLAYFVDFMEIENHKYDGTLPIEKRDDGEYEFEFRDVSFSYPNSNKPVLDHVSFKIKIGKKMALVGPNGAGKTTFIKLLCRLYDPTEGAILLNGIDIRYYDYNEYIQLFSVVFQDFKLFSFSIAENVAASREVDEARVKECLQKAGFQKRLADFDKDIHTNLYQLEEDGVEISGGEAQKIAIARALYKNAPMVILDEPTSALDPESEYEIYQSFDELVEDKTAIYISHRMSSCRFCGQILVFDEGKIVQQGSHEKLLEDKNGLYYEMWNAQAKYYQ